MPPTTSHPRTRPPRHRPLLIRARLIRAALIRARSASEGKCLIDCEQQGRGFYFHSGETPASVVQGLTIRNGTAYEGGGVYCSGSRPTLINCTISGNGVMDYGSGAGLYCGSNASPMLTNCILWADTPHEIHRVSGSSPDVTYCAIQGGWEGLGNIHADPLFVDPDGPDDDPATWEDNDYRLGPGSPCIDAGDNSAVPPDAFDLDGDCDVSEPVPFDLGGQPRFVDDVTTPDTGSGTPPLVDMGAYEYAPPWPRGDLNCDNSVNVFDIDPFVLALTSGPGCEPYYDEYPDCDCMLADINCDGNVNVFDIDPFVQCLVGDCPRARNGRCACSFAHTPPLASKRQRSGLGSRMGLGAGDRVALAGASGSDRAGEVVGGTSGRHAPALLAGRSTDTKLASPSSAPEIETRAPKLETRGRNPKLKLKTRGRNPKLNAETRNSILKPRIRN